MLWRRRQCRQKGHQFSGLPTTRLREKASSLLAPAAGYCMPGNNVSGANGNPQQIQKKHTAVSIHIYPTDDEVGPTATGSHVSKCKNLLDRLETLADWKGITTITL